MAVAVFVRYENVGMREYDALMARLGFDAVPPIGEILHVAAEAEGCVDVCEVWQTEDSARSFIEQRLRPALSEMGSPGELEVRIEPLHNLYAADMETIERIGAVSLPAHVASTVLY